MNLSRMLLQRENDGDPVRVGIIGCGKFGAMYLSQARLTKGVHVVGIADLNVARAKETLSHIGWEAERFAATSFEEAEKNRSTFVTEDSAALINNGGLDVLIEATGDPAAGIRHCLSAISHGLHVVMVNVEADVVAGPLLARKAELAGVVYSLAWGDQPALIAEHVDWARSCGFKVVSAGKGTRYLPTFHQSTPETVWDHFGWDLEVVKRGRLNPKMFNSFLDGTKSGIEMSAVCNATGLTPQPDGLAGHLQFGRGRDSEARSQGRRGAGRRGRVLRLGQADARSALPERGISAARACPACEAEAGDPGGRAAPMGRRGYRLG
jgi:predicted homoserine dehydrogenase-like protein